jgi:hypothetical protein
MKNTYKITYGCNYCDFQTNDAIAINKHDCKPSQRAWPNDGHTQCDECQRFIDEPDKKKRPEYCGLPHYGECCYFQWPPFCKTKVFDLQAKIERQQEEYSKLHEENKNIRYMYDDLKAKIKELVQ